MIKNDCGNEFACELTIVLPCLNEEKTVGVCDKKAKNFLQENKIFGEVVGADNGSTDRLAEIASSNGARVISEADAPDVK